MTVIPRKTYCNEKISVPEFIDPVFAKIGSLNSGTGKENRRDDLVKNG